MSNALKPETSLAPQEAVSAPTADASRPQASLLDITPVEAALLFLFLFAIHITAGYNYLLFHSTAELFSVAIAATIFLIVINGWQWITNQYVRFIGIAYGFIAVLDVLHTVSFKGMSVFTDYDYYAPQLWIAARYLESASMVLAFAFLGTNRRISLPVSLAGFSLVTVSLAASILYFRNFPVCFVPGTGLTAFKIVGEYIVCLLLLVALALLYWNRSFFEARTYRQLQFSIVTMIAMEICFTLFISDAMSDFINQLGHLLKICAFYIIYKTVVVAGFRNPISLLTRELKATEEKLSAQRELRQAEEAMRKLNAELEQRVAERTAELEAANRELEAFSYSVSHDLRAPLRAIEGFSKLLVEDQRERLDEEGRHELDSICRSATRMQHLIDDLLELSRSARREMRSAPVDMAALAREVFDELQETASGRKPSFHVGELPKAMGDRALIREVLANLLSNAIKFTALCPEPRIELGGSAGATENTYYVQDNGAGFDMHYRDRLFGVFQRLHSATQFEGTGVGLAIVKRIVTRHGGNVWAEGQVGQGAKIGFTLPRA